MYPVLFQIGPLTVHTYGVAMAAAFLLGFFLCARRAPYERLDPETVMDSFLPIFLGTMLGARFLYVFTDIKGFMEDPIEIFRVWKGGLVFYGGFLGGMTGTFFFLRKRPEVKFWALKDLFAPYVGLGYAIHRTFGCFLGNGCCYGGPTDLPWGILYPDEHVTRHQYGLQPLHPSQVYESITGLIIMTVVLLYRGRPHKIGVPSGIFFVIYAVSRFFTEYTRGDSLRGFWGPLSTSQWISIGIFLTGIYLFVRKAPILTPLNEAEAAQFVKDLEATRASSDEKTPKDDKGGKPDSAGASADMSGTEQ